MSKPRPRKTASGSATADRPKVLDAITPDAESDLLRRLWNFNAQLRDAGEVEKVLAAALRMSTDYFRVQQGCVAALRPGHEKAEILLPTPAESRWDQELLAAFLRGHKVDVPRDLMLARVRRYNRMWGALVIRSPGANFPWDARKAFSSIGVAATQLIERLNDLRIREVRTRIDHKILEQIGPKDLFYQILHGIRSLIAYDHSAALLTCDDDGLALEVVAEQNAWRKAKSQNVGLKLPVSRPLLELLSRKVVYGFNREGKAWHDWTESQGGALADLLDYNRQDPLKASIVEGAMLCAPLISRHGLLGILKVAAVNSGTFGAYEADVISQFLPQIAVALQNMRRTESLEMRVRTAERKQAMADLARAVSHDVNNAIGAVVPLVQQMQEDCQAGGLTAETIQADLIEVERSLQICRRIFGGMLSFARGAARNSSVVYLHHAVDCTLSIFREGLERLGVEMTVNVPADLPPLVGIQADFDQLLLNLISNAREAMEAGGALAIGAARLGDRIELTVIDTGCGISAEHMRKIEEPFFTTKRSGNGLGLSICRSIVAQMRGKLQIVSKVGEGTTVRVSFPIQQEQDA